MKDSVTLGLFFFMVTPFSRVMELHESLIETSLQANFCYNNVLQMLAVFL